MFKDKNFGLPKNLVESARSVMQNQYGKKKPPVKKPATTSSNNLPENHVVKFTSYLKENFHINELTEEEIAWIYENEYVQWSEETAVDIRRQARRNPSQQPDVLTRLGRGISDIASRAYDALPNVSDAAKLDNSWRQREKEDAEEGRRAAANARATERDREDAESGAQMRQRAATTSTTRPSASARREPPTRSSVYNPNDRIMKDTGADAPDFGRGNNATFNDDGKPVFKSDTETKRTAYLRTKPTRQSSTRLSTGPKEDWRKSVFERND